MNEKAATGSFGRYKERADRLVEALQLIRELWKGEPVNYKGNYYQTENAWLYDPPEKPIPIYVAASGPNSARIAGEYGDGWITPGPGLRKSELREAFQEGAEAAGKDPDTMPKIVNTSVVVGSQQEAEYAANPWRFTLDPWGEPLYESDPRKIQRVAEEQFSLEKVYKNWPVSEDPEKHVRTMQDLIDTGATQTADLLIKSATQVCTEPDRTSR